MKKIAALLVCLTLAIGMPLTAHADDMTIKTVVPERHEVAVEASGGRVIADNHYCGDTVLVDRQKEQTWWLVPNEGKVLKALYYNGQNVTGQMNGDTFTAPPLTDNASLRAVFVDSVPQKEHYDLVGTVTDSSGNPVPGATVDIGGHTGTTGSGGDFKIKDVPPGSYPVVITDKDGTVIGTGEITVKKPGSGDLSVTTDGSGNPVITPGKNTDKIGMTLEVGNGGGVTVKKIKDTTPKQSMSDSPKTGDGNHPVLWLLIMIAACGGSVFCITAIRRKEKNVNSERDPQATEL